MIFVKGLLSYYGLPLSQSTAEVPISHAISVPNGVKFELNTLPVRTNLSLQIIVTNTVFSF